ncbi:MAG: FecR family protein, partial [Bdellovibrionales bacterium]
TGANATVILNYADNSRVKLKENTEIVIHAGKAAEPKGLAVVLGGVFALVTKHPGQSFKVHTPVAVSGVRGTEFFMSYDKSSSKGKPGDAWMCVQEGLVEITENDHPAPVLVKAGFGVVVEHGREIAPPQAYAWTKNLNWNMDPADGEIMDKSNVGEDYRKSLLKNDYE